MNRDKPPLPRQPGGPAGRQTDGKAERLAAALRENLRRRKAQQHSRQASEPTEGHEAQAKDPSRRKP